MARGDAYGGWNVIILELADDHGVPLKLLETKKVQKSKHRNEASDAQMDPPQQERAGDGNTTSKADTNDPTLRAALALVLLGRISREDYDQVDKASETHRQHFKRWTGPQAELLADAINDMAAGKTTGGWEAIWSSLKDRIPKNCMHSRNDKWSYLEFIGEKLVELDSTTTEALAIVSNLSKGNKQSKAKRRKNNAVDETRTQRPASQSRESSQGPNRPNQPVSPAPGHAPHEHGESSHEGPESFGGPRNRGKQPVRPTALPGHHKGGLRGRTAVSANGVRNESSSRENVLLQHGNLASVSRSASSGAGSLARSRSASSASSLDGQGTHRPVAGAPRHVLPRRPRPID